MRKSERCEEIEAYLGLSSIGPLTVGNPKAHKTNRLWAQIGAKPNSFIVWVQIASIIATTKKKKNPKNLELQIRRSTTILNPRSTTTHHDLHRFKTQPMQLIQDPLIHHDPHRFKTHNPQPTPDLREPWPTTHAGPISTEKPTNHTHIGANPLEQNIKATLEQNIETRPGLGVAGRWWLMVAWWRAKGEGEISKREQREREKSERERRGRQSVESRRVRGIK